MMNKLAKKAIVVLTVAAMAVTGCVAVSANDGMGTTEYQRTCPINITDTYEVQYVTGVVDSLNVRNDAFINADVIGSLVNGQQVIVTGYVEVAYAGNYSTFVRINYNGTEGFVDSSFLGYEQAVEPAQAVAQVVANPTTNPAQATPVADTVVYPRVDKHLSNGTTSTWCSLNTDGFYYNENGVRFADNGNGTFSDVNGTVYNQI